MVLRSTVWYCAALLLCCFVPEQKLLEFAQVDDDLTDALVLRCVVVSASREHICALNGVCA